MIYVGTAIKCKFIGLAIAERQGSKSEKELTCLLIFNKGVKQNNFLFANDEVMRNDCLLNFCCVCDAILFCCNGTIIIVSSEYMVHCCCCWRDANHIVFRLETRKRLNILLTCAAPLLVLFAVCWSLVLCLSWFFRPCTLDKPNRERERGIEMIQNKKTRCNFLSM